jgi:chemotaxis protein MotA
MFSIIGIIVVFGAIVGGFLMEKGSLLVLVQPAELVIIAGAALGTGSSATLRISSNAFWVV